jgi:hypothetical protein
MNFFLPLQTLAFKSFLQIKAQNEPLARTKFFFTILQDRGLGFVLFERELFTPSDEGKGFFLLLLSLILGDLETSKTFKNHHRFSRQTKFSTGLELD